MIDVQSVGCVVVAELFELLELFAREIRVEDVGRERVLCRCALQVHARADWVFTQRRVVNVHQTV